MDECMSGHSWVMGRSPSQIGFVNQQTWHNLTPELIISFQKHYDALLSLFDGFICAHPNSFILLFEKYNKPIIIVNSCRYDIPFSMTGYKEMLPELDAAFNRLQEKGLFYMISNNYADNKYFLAANPLIQTSIIPSLCLYTNLIWDPAVTPR